MTVHVWAELTRAEIAEIAPTAVTILPVASIEQHGPHLATVTDSAVIEEIVTRACRIAGDDIELLIAPLLPYGSSDHHLSFGGTLSLRSTTLRVVLGDLIRSMSSAGCSRILVLNGHGGNSAICAIVASESAREEHVMVATTSYWELIEPPREIIGPPREVGRYMGHAGRFETSVMLAARPELVHLDRAKRSPGPVEPSMRGLSVVPPDLWQQRDGFTDDPTLADSAVGDEILTRCSTAVAQALREIAKL